MIENVNVNELLEKLTQKNQEVINKLIDELNQRRQSRKVAKEETKKED